MMSTDQPTDTVASMKVISLSILKLLLIECFGLQGYCNPKIKRGHQTSTTYDQPPYQV